MTTSGFILHGTIIYSNKQRELVECQDSYLVCVDGYSRGVFPEIPEEYGDLPVEDYWDKLIIPGLADLSADAPGFQVRGMGLNRTDWADYQKDLLEAEEEFDDDEYAERAYDMFVEDLYIGPTTRAVVTATGQVAATLKLMDLLDESGLISCVGKVIRDRGVSDFASHTTGTAATDTVDWINACIDRYDRTSPLLLTEGSDSASPDLLDALGQLVRETDLPVGTSTGIGRTQGSLPSSAFFDLDEAKVLSRAGLLGEMGPAILSPALVGSSEVIDLLKDRGTYLASCPEMEVSLWGQIAPVKTYLDLGLNVGLGSASAGGSGTSLFTVMKEALLLSKLAAGESKDEAEPLTLEDVFYLATRGSGSFFGNCGSFEEGCQFDAVVVDDRGLDTMRDLSPRDRLERVVALSDDRNVVGKYVFGDKIY